MLLLEFELRAMGFRRRAERYGQWERRFGLPAGGHLSVFPWGEQSLAGGRLLVELDTFHVTFAVGGEHVHFYFHERAGSEWDPGGHTSAAEVLRLGGDVRELRARADAVAALLVAVLPGTLRPRP